MRLPETFFRHPFARGAFFIAMALGTCAMGVASWPYFFGEDLHAFIIEKLPVPAEDLYLSSLHVHVATALFALSACTILLSRGLLRRAPRVHRHLGRVVGVVILFALIPSGLHLAIFAKGGFVVTVGFALSAAIVVAALVHGVLTARRGDLVAHRRDMLHVTAQLSVAVTSRAMLVAFDALSVDPEFAYVAALYVPVVFSALVVEVVAPRSRAPRAERPAHASVVVPLALAPRPLDAALRRPVARR